MKFEKVAKKIILGGVIYNKSWTPVLCLLTIILFAGVSLFSTRTPNTFWIGLLRADGIIIPIAQYHDGNWSNSWPTPVEISVNELHLPLNKISDIPEAWLGYRASVANTWYFFSVNGDFKKINLLKPAVYETYDVANWGLLSNYSEKSIEPDKRIGIVLDSMDFVDRVDHWAKIEQNSKNYQTIIKFLEPFFTSLETEKISEASTEQTVEDKRLAYTRHPIAEEERENERMTIDKLYCCKSPKGRYLYYYEVRKEYEGIDSTGAECESITFMNGWINMPKDEEYIILDTNMYLTDCDFQEPTSHFPLSVLIINESAFAIVENKHYEVENYSILKIGNSDVQILITTEGGGL